MGVTLKFLNRAPMLSTTEPVAEGISGRANGDVNIAIVDSSLPEQRKLLAALPNFKAVLFDSRTDTPAQVLSKVFGNY